MNTIKMLQCYTKANLFVDSAYEVAIKKGSRSGKTETAEGVCGFLVPLSGKALYKFEDRTFALHRGRVLHAGPAMALEKEVATEAAWQYMLIHYRVEGDPAAKQYLEQSLFTVALCGIQTKKINALARGLIYLHGQTGPGAELKKKMLIYQFAQYLIQASQEPAEASDRDKVEHITNYIQEHMKRGLTVEKLAAELFMETKAFAYLFTKIMGVSPKKYLVTATVRKAEELLMDSDRTIGEVAFEVGFEDPLYFSRVFRKHTGYAPSEFRKRVGKY